MRKRNVIMTNEEKVYPTDDLGAMLVGDVLFTPDGKEIGMVRSADKGETTSIDLPMFQPKRRGLTPFGFYDATRATAIRIDQ